MRGVDISFITGGVQIDSDASVNGTFLSHFWTMGVALRLKYCEEFGSGPVSAKVDV